MSAVLSIIAGAGFLAAVVVLRAAPCAATIFPEHPHVEGGIAVKLKEQGAPPDQTTRASKRLPAAVQGQAPGCRDLQRSPGVSAIATVRLKPEAARGTFQKLT